MILIENISIIPLKDYLKKEMTWDFFISCGSFEERCKRTSNIILAKKIKIANSIIFNYVETDEDHKKDKYIREMKKNLEKNSDSVKFFNNSSVFEPSQGIKQFKDFLIENRLDLHDKHVFIDITVLTKPYIFLLFKILIEEFQLKSFEVTYTEPGFYGNENAKNEFILTEGLNKVNSIPGFRGESSNSDDALIVILGFEGKRSLDIYSDINPDITYSINGFPSFKSGWHKKSFEANMRFLIESRSIDHLFFSPANDPFETMKVLEEVVSEIKRKHSDLDIVVAPLGTKLQAFGVLLFALKNKFIRVVYPFPTVYSSSYSKGYGKTWIFKVNFSL